MELKVVCQCGQKFKFDVEPVNGQMPFTVNCPLCGADGTATANQMLAAMLASQPPAATPPPPPAPVGGLRLSQSTAASGPPPAPVQASAAPSAPAPAGGLRINRSHSETPPAPAPASASADPAMAPAMVGAAARAAHLATQPAPKKTSFGMGLLGGVIGALVGVTVYFFIFKYTDWHFKLIAVGVGALAGWFADFLGKGDGSKELGGITAVFVLAGIIGAQYFVALGWWHDFEETELKEAAAAYDRSVTEAKEVVKVIPTGSEFEIRNYLAKQASADGEKMTPAQVSVEDVKFFREKELPEYQELASGNMTRAQYEAKYKLKSSMSEEEKQDDENTFKGVFLLLLLSKANLFSLAAAAGIAYKLSTNAD